MRKMVSNKDEAAKTKQLAEKKFQENDIIYARRLAMKAQKLCPALDGIRDLLAALNIHVSSKRKINGQVDYYGVLGVEPSSDEDTLKKQYRILALTLHPDKNNSVAAEGAFKILSEAWTVLSDKGKRRAYDQKRGTEVKPSRGLESDGNDGNLCNRSTYKYPDPIIWSEVYWKVTPIRSSKPNGNVCNETCSVYTFWTMCMGCEMQFEYARLYLNKNLECQNCKQPFVAKQIPSWINGVRFGLI